MGQLSLQVGALNRSISAPDDKMTQVLGLVVDVTGGPSGGTAAQRADWVLRIIKEHLVTLANSRDSAIVTGAAEAGRAKINLD